MSYRMGLFTAALLVFASVAPGATVVGWWNFETGISDQMGNFADGALAGGATVGGGQLNLPSGGGGQYYRTGAYLGSAIGDKTLVSWVRLNNLTDGGGSVLTLEKNGGSQFDGIVYAERQAKRWMAGSNNWFRTQDVSGPGAIDESLTAPDLIQMAIVYSGNSIALYRNGAPYGNAYTMGTQEGYPTTVTDVIFGLRHVGAGGGSISVSIEDARVYSGALTQAELQRLVPNTLIVPEPASLAMLAMGALLMARRRRA